MRTNLTMPVVLYLSLRTTAGSAQTFAEQMQRAIYTQEATGDLDSAIAKYRQIPASAPLREFADQAQLRLAPALLQRGNLQNAALEFQSFSQSYTESKDLIASMASPSQPMGQAELGTLQNGRYRSFQTNVELTFPEGWSFKSDGEATGNGQMAVIGSASGSTVQVWMKPLVMAPDDIALRLRKEMEKKLSMRPEGWKIRPESVRERSLSGHPGLSAIADYTEGGTPMVEYDFWVLTGKTFLFFFGKADAQNLETLQADIETVANSAQIP